MNKMLNTIKNFAANESGAVTVDWVVLTAAVVGLGLAVLSLIKGKTETLTNKIGSAMDSMTVSTNF
jgi:Flp pilus assembly pilin Flp